MELSVREARAQFAHALSAAQRGERVTITKNGKPIAELGPPSVKPKKVWDWDALNAVQKELGIEAPRVPLDDEWRRQFDDPAFSREVLGLDDDREPSRP